MLISIILPFLSHVVRQSVACAHPSVESFVFSSFLFCYAFSMCVHSLYVDRMSLCHIRVALVLFLLTFVASVVIRIHASRYFSIAYSVHALVSSVMWPLGYRLVNSQKRYRISLVVWSLQANVGDLVGCRYQIFENPFQKDVYTIFPRTYPLISSTLNIPYLQNTNNNIMCRSYESVVSIMQKKIRTFSWMEIRTILNNNKTTNNKRTIINLMMGKYATSGLDEPTLEKP